MKAHLTGYFLTYHCVYLLDSACKGCSLQFFKFVVRFSRIMFLKSDLFYFVLVAKAYGFCLRARPVNSDHILNVLETVKFVFCSQIHALAECTMNSKFCKLHSAPAASCSILHSAPAASCSMQNFSFIVHSARACICKQNTNVTVSNP